MTTRPPAEIGMTLDEVDTPALIVDLDAFERNLRRLPERIAGTGVRMRPHAKTHKCPVIALQQVALGAVGVCVQKVSEAEAMVQGGVQDVLVTNEIVGRQKLRRLAALAHMRPDRRLRRRSGPGPRARRGGRGEAGVTLPVYVEVNMGGNRCGVEPGEPALALARQIARRAAPRLWRVAGLSRLGAASARLGGAPPGDRPGRRQGRRTRDLLARHGIECPTITGAGTGTFEFESASGVYTELQCGSYIFMDADYGRNLDRDGAPTKAFEPSLFVWATVMSRPAEDRAIVDAGLKALAFDSGPPLVCDEPAATYERASDEHGRLAVSGATNRLSIGDKIRLVPGHCDPTVNLYDWYVGIRGNRVEQLWPITARGAVY